MGISYKLVDRDGFSRHGLPGETQWLPIGSTVHPTGYGTEECGPGVLHAYATPEIGVLMNPFHVDISSPRCLRVGNVDDGWWQSNGVMRWTTSPVIVLEEIEVPRFELEELVAWAIVIAPHPATREWAIRWLSGEDRTADAADEISRRDIFPVPSGNYAACAALAMETSTRWKTEFHAAHTASNTEAPYPTQKEVRLMVALARARAILAGKFPADRFDEKLA